MKERRIKINWNAAALGAGVGLVALVVLTAAAAGLLAGEGIGLEAMGYLTAGVLVGSSFLGSLTALGGGGGAAGAAAAAGAELVVLAGLNLALNGGRVEGVGVTVLALAGGCGAAVLLSMGRGGRPKRRRRRSKNR